VTKKKMRRSKEKKEKITYGVMLPCIVSYCMSHSYVTVWYDGMGWDGIWYDKTRYAFLHHYITFLHVLYFYLVFCYILFLSPSRFLVLLPLYFFTTPPPFLSQPLHSFSHHLSFRILTTSPLFFHHLSFRILTTSHLPHQLSSRFLTTFTTSSLLFSIKLNSTYLYLFSHH
jgi:hypothetical protein